MSKAIKKTEFKIKGEYIELVALLKIMDIASSGGEAGIMVNDGLIKLNGQTEFRKRAKLRPGDVVKFEETEIKIV